MNESETNSPVQTELMDQIVALRHQVFTLLLALVVVSGTLTVTSTSASALAVGANGATNPALQVSANIASAVTGIDVISNASGSGCQVNVISSNLIIANEWLI